MRGRRSAAPASPRESELALLAPGRRPQHPVPVLVAVAVILAVLLLATLALRVRPVALGPVPGRLAAGPWLAAGFVGGPPGVTPADVRRRVCVLGLPAVAQPLGGLSGTTTLLILRATGTTRSGAGLLVTALTGRAATGLLVVPGRTGLATRLALAPRTPRLATLELPATLLLLTASSLLTLTLLTTLALLAALALLDTGRSDLLLASPGATASSRRRRSAGGLLAPVWRPPGDPLLADPRG